MAKLYFKDNGITKVAVSPDRSINGVSPIEVTGTFSTPPIVVAHNASSIDASTALPIKSLTIDSSGHVTAISREALSVQMWYPTQQSTYTFKAGSFSSTTDGNQVVYWVKKFYLYYGDVPTLAISLSGQIWDVNTSYFSFDRFNEWSNETAHYTARGYGYT